MINRRNRPVLLGVLSGVTVALAALLVAPLIAPDPAGEGSGNAATRGLPSLSGELFNLRELEAQVGAGEPGDYLFFPNRRNMWVVNKRTGRMIHYKFIDVAKGTVERSYSAQINQEIFPPGDTAYMISERNIADYLWVCNQRTGDFQLWRRNVRDGRLVTDRDVVEPSRQLLSPAVTGPGKSANNR